MRGAKKSIDIPRPIEQVWAWLEDVRNWNHLDFGLVWNKRRCRHRIGSRALDAAGSETEAFRAREGGEVLLETPRGTEKMRWRICEAAPPHRLSYHTAAPRFFNGYQASATWKLSTVVKGATRVELGLYLIFNNPALELFSLIFPAGLIYRAYAGRCLKAMRLQLR